MNPVSIIAKKRGEQRLTKGEIQYFVEGCVAGEIETAQMGILIKVKLSS